MSSSIMLNNRIAAALLAIVIASSFITVSDFVGSVSAYAAKKVTHHEYGMTLPLPFSDLPAVSSKDKSVSRTSHSANPDDSGLTIRDAKSIPTKEMFVWRAICNT